MSFHRIGAGSTYVTDILPPLVLFGLGMSITVAPLTATVMGSVPSHQSGIASAVNNAASRVAGLIGVAAAGAVTSVAFGASLSSALARARLPAAAMAGLEAARRDPTGIHGAGLSPDAVAVLDASATAAFHWTMVACAALAALGGLAAAKTAPAVAVAGHTVSYDQDRSLWYSDIQFDWSTKSGTSYFPFVRLALARYQPEVMSA